MFSENIDHYDDDSFFNISESVKKNIYFIIFYYRED